MNGEKLEVMATLIEAYEARHYPEGFPGRCRSDQI